METAKEVIKLSELLENAFLQHGLNNPKKNQIINFIFSEFAFFKKILKFKTKDGFQLLESRQKNTIIPNSARIVWLSELLRHADSIKISIDALTKLLAA